MPFGFAVLELGLNIFHGFMKSRVSKNFFCDIALDSPFQTEKILGDHFGNGDAIFCSKKFGKIREILVQTDIESTFAHNILLKASVPIVRKTGTVVNTKFGSFAKSVDCNT